MASAAAKKVTAAWRDPSRRGVAGFRASGVTIASIIAAVAVLLIQIDRNPVVRMTAMTSRYESPTNGRANCEAIARSSPCFCTAAVNRNPLWNRMTVLDANGSKNWV